MTLTKSPLHEYTFTGTTSGRVEFMIAGDTVKCEAVTCTNDATTVIEWRDGTPGGVREAFCDLDACKLRHPARGHLHAEDVTALVLR